eukprot:1159980-Pelagomonas_calceolata.AAC.7
MGSGGLLEAPGSSRKELFEGKKAWLNFKLWCLKGGTGSYRCVLVLTQGDANFKQAYCRAEGFPKRRNKVA